MKSFRLDTTVKHTDYRLPLSLAGIPIIAAIVFWLILSNTQDFLLGFILMLVLLPLSVTLAIGCVIWLLIALVAFKLGKK